MKTFNAHLISDNSIETLHSIINSTLLQFDDLKAKTYLWPLIKDEQALADCLSNIEKKPGMVFYIIANAALREKLKEFCYYAKLPCLGVLGKIIKEVSNYLNVEAAADLSEFKMDNDYFERMEAIDFTLKHDDGQKIASLEQADIVILGPSRTSKSPTCIYLAFTGLKAANIPIVPGIDLPIEITKLQQPLIVGLTIDPKRLIEIRNNRINITAINKNFDYVDYEQVNQECRATKKIFNKYNWPIIDVTSKSIEEIASDILKIYIGRKQELGRKLLL